MPDLLDRRGETPPTHLFIHTFDHVSDHSPDLHLYLEATAYRVPLLTWDQGLEMARHNLLARHFSDGV
jgi:hypothetical protein